MGFVHGFFFEFSPCTDEVGDAGPEQVHDALATFVLLDRQPKGLGVAVVV